MDDLRDAGSLLEKARDTIPKRKRQVRVGWNWKDYPELLEEARGWVAEKRRGQGTPEAEAAKPGQASREQSY